MNLQKETDPANVDSEVKTEFLSKVKTGTPLIVLSKQHGVSHQSIYDWPKNTVIIYDLVVDNNIKLFFYHKKVAKGEKEGNNRLEPGSKAVEVPNHDISQKILIVQARGFEPPQACSAHRVLSPARIPFRHACILSDPIIPKLEHSLQLS